MSVLNTEWCYLLFVVMSVYEIIEMDWKDGPDRETRPLPNGWVLGGRSAGLDFTALYFVSVTL